MGLGFNPRLVREALESYRQTIPKEEVFKLARIDEQLEWLAKGENFLSMERQGGAHLGAVREFLQMKARNGESVTWGSNDEVFFRQPVTVKLIEEIGCRAAAGAINEIKGLR